MQYEDIKFNVSFDINIQLISSTVYTGTITLDLPTGNIMKNGTSTYEKNTFEDVIFKRN